MAVGKAPGSRGWAALIAAVGVACLGAGMVIGDPRSQGWCLRSSYDLLHAWSFGRPTVSDSPVVLVYLDRNAFLQKGLDPLQRWPRALHARLLERLTSAGARAVVFDILFDAAAEPPEGDRALAAAIRGSGRVVLAAEHNDKISHELDAAHDWARAFVFRPPYELFAESAAAWGIASLWVDDDRVVRRHLAGFVDDAKPTLAWATAAWLQVPVTRASEAMARANTRWVRYYGPALTLPHVGYDEALAPGGVPDERFRDKIVLVGARPVEGFIHAERDQFRNPFHSWANQEYFMPGVEVHATQLLNLLRGDGLARRAPWEECGILAVFGCLLGGGLTWLRPTQAAGMALVAGAGILGFAVWSFGQNVWFPWLAVVAVQIPAGFVGSIAYHSVEWYRTRRRLEAARRQDEAKIREQAALIEAAHDAILVEDLAGRIVYANPSAERLYGWTLAELQSPAVSRELFSVDAAAVQAARATALASGECHSELRQQTRAGQVVTVESRWTLIRDGGGGLKALLLVSRDVTARKELEAQFLRTQRLNTIGTLAGGMAHDLNNALAPILMGVHLLRRRTEDDESRRLLGLMETNTQRGADLVRQVLLFARGRGGERERIELGPLVRELEAMVRETFPKDIAVETYLPPDLWAVRGNPTQLHQVLLNLCVNARDAMPNGGRLSFVLDNVELDSGEAAAIPGATPGAFVSLLVSDTGTGMSPEVQARLFEPFFTTKGEGAGTGIGLSTVQRIVHGHRGWIRVESETGRGTTVEVFLPRCVDGAERSDAAGWATLVRGEGECMLVVDDEQSIRQLVAEGLIAHGYRVLTAGDGAEALVLYDRHAAEIRLLITDTAMPVMGGGELVRRLRERRPELPVVVVSADARGFPADAGSVQWLAKPFALDDLLRAAGEGLRAWKRSGAR